MARALYRTHRPKKLAEVVGQEHITTALGHALSKGTLSHAYLFTGPRGVGKTSIARILAHEINGLPYEDDATHLDIIEIDAASNRRIDEIRDLRDKVHIAPTSAKYKVYIIDEVHMLTKEAFNALLKTLEEPPAHVVFILATTEAHKLPETIISRTQRYVFKPVDLSQVVEHLRAIAQKEGIAITDDALGLIAQHGEGSFRDSISLLDQIRNQDKEVGISEVQAMLGIAPAEAIASLVQAVAQHDAVAIAQNLRHMQNQGYEPAQLAKQLGQVLRQALISGEATLPHDTLMQLLARLVEVPASPEPRVFLEITLLDTALQGLETPASTTSAPASSSGKAPQNPPAPPKVMSEEVQTKAATVTAKHPSSFKKPLVEKNAPEPVLNESAPTSSAVLNADTWAQVLATIKQKYSTLYSVAHSAQPHFEPGVITLEFSYAFHQKRLNEKKNKEIIANCVQQVSGEAVQINCTLGASAPAATVPSLPPADDEQVHTVKAAPSSEAPKNEAVATISNIFGGAEVLES